MAAFSFFLSFSTLSGFSNAWAQVPATTDSITVPGGGHCADRDKDTDCWATVSHCSPRRRAGLLQPQGSAQPAGEVHFLPFRALDEGVVLKDAGRQSQPEARVCRAGLAFSDPSWDAQARIPSEQLESPDCDCDSLGQELQGRGG